MNEFRWSSMSRIRKRYFLRLIGRIAVLIGCTVLCVCSPEQFSVLEGANFFSHPSLLHLLWIVWMIDMLGQLLPISRHVALGSQKLFRQRFRPIMERINRDSLRQYIVTTTKAAFLVLLLWTALIILIGFLHHAGILSRTGVFMISVVFYVCDLICVLIWCPFRLLMRTRCCTTCRIFNWDHLMMFSPMIFMGGFYAVSLICLAFLAWLIWEVCIMMYPERFWDKSNAALKCSSCTDKLCTQYCQKLRK